MPVDFTILSVSEVQKTHGSQLSWSEGRIRCLKARALFYVALAGLALATWTRLTWNSDPPTSLPPECWDSRCVPPRPACHFSNPVGFPHLNSITFMFYFVVVHHHCLGFQRVLVCNQFLPAVLCLLGRWALQSCIPSRNTVGTGLGSVYSWNSSLKFGWKNIENLQVNELCGNQMLWVLEK